MPEFRDYLLTELDNCCFILTIPRPLLVNQLVFFDGRQMVNFRDAVAIIFNRLVCIVMLIVIGFTIFRVVVFHFVFLVRPAYVHSFYGHPLFVA
jgi:hypothetical protein